MYPENIFRCHHYREPTLQWFYIFSNEGASMKRRCALRSKRHNENHTWREYDREFLETALQCVFIYIRLRLLVWFLGLIARLVNLLVARLLRVVWHKLLCDCFIWWYIFNGCFAISVVMKSSITIFSKVTYELRYVTIRTMRGYTTFLFLCERRLNDLVGVVTLCLFCVAFWLHYQSGNAPSQPTPAVCEQAKHFA